MHYYVYGTYLVHMCVDCSFLDHDHPQYLMSKASFWSTLDSNKCCRVVATSPINAKSIFGSQRGLVKTPDTLLIVCFALMSKALP